MKFPIFIISTLLITGCSSIQKKDTERSIASNTKSTAIRENQCASLKEKRPAVFLSINEIHEAEVQAITIARTVAQKSKNSDLINVADRLKIVFACHSRPLNPVDTEMTINLYQWFESESKTTRHLNMHEKEKMIKDNLEKLAGLN